MPQKHSHRSFWLRLMLVSTVGLTGLTGCLVRGEEDHDRGRDRDHDDHDRVVVVHPVVVDHDEDHHDRR